MKNFILSVIAVLFVATSAFGQEKTVKDLGKEGEMVFNFSYNNAKDLNSILSKNNYKDLDQLSDANPALLNYLKSTSDLKNFTGVEFVEFSKVLLDYQEKHPGKVDVDSDEFKKFLFGSDYDLFTNINTNERGIFGAIWGAIKEAVVWVYDHIEEIVETIILICSLPIISC